jgi:hypothetical protein
LIKQKKEDKLQAGNKSRKKAGEKPFNQWSKTL